MPVPLEDLFYANSLPSLLLATSFRAASCVIMRGFHCCANWPEIEVSGANVKFSSLSSRP